MATHNRFVRMEQRRQEQARLAYRMQAGDRQREQDTQLDKLYFDKRKRFFPMSLTDGQIHIHVLQDIDAFRTEAEIMHHCVYSCGYWNMKTHPDSLILSATIDGCHVETIEVNLKFYRIQQAYGKHNKFTPFHERILSLVNDNMDIIRDYNKLRAA